MSGGMLIRIDGRKGQRIEDTKYYPSGKGTIKYELKKATRPSEKKN